MASFLNKAKDKIEATLNQNKSDSSRTDNYDNTTSTHTGGHGNTQAYNQHSTTGTTAGYGTSETYGSNTNNPSYNNPQSTNEGPHKSNLLNKLDPRTDSDRDHRNDPTSRVGGHGNTQHDGSYGTTGGVSGISGADHGSTAIHHATTHPSHGHTGQTGGLASSTTTGTSGHGLGSNTYDNPQSTTAGPHSSNLLNKADPRVDSDRDHRNDPTSRVGGYGAQGENYGQTGTAGYTSGNTGGYNTYDNTQSTTAGPHSSNLLNKADPRVDSDRDHRNDPTSRVGGYGTQGDNYVSTGATGGYSAGTTGGYTSGTTAGYGADNTTGGYGGSHTTTHTGGHTGHHAETYGGNTGGVGGTSGGYGDDYNNTPGSGNAQGTAGPHNSNILNKLDPRVDSDMDGSKTYGGNQTHR